MKLKIKFKAKKVTENGKPRTEIANPALYRHHLSKFKDGEEVWVTIENTKSQRSSKQNNYYWLCLHAIADYTGHEPDEIHQYCKETFLDKRIIAMGGKDYAVTGSTTKLSKGQFVEFFMKVQAFAGSLGIELPDPKDLDIAVLQTNQN